MKGLSKAGNAILRNRGRPLTQDELNGYGVVLIRAARQKEYRDAKASS